MTSTAARAMPQTSAESLIDSLSAHHPKGYDLSLDRIERILDRLGNPHRNIQPAIHVAGTNGKGSVIAFCRAILEAAGKTVHVHTSPHLVNWHERFRIGHEGGGTIVDDARLENAIARVAEANGGEPITIFEILTAAMFLLFSENPADYCAIEVGLGGRFDATNVIEKPLVSIITSISLDHQAQLGDTVEQIAGEKAGIIKPGCPVVIGPQVDSVAEILAEIAAERSAPAMIAGRDFTFFEQAGRLIYQDEMGLLDLPLPRLRGRHQLGNAATAIAATRHAGIEVTDETLETAMHRVTWPGRLEHLKPGRLAALAPTAEIWIDGGHNIAAATAIATELAELEDRSPMPVVMIVGMLTTKDPAGFFATFAGLPKQVIAVPIRDSEAGHDPAALATMAGEAGISAAVAGSVSEALADIGRTYEDSPVRVMITGSLYLLGEVLAENATLPE